MIFRVARGAGQAQTRERTAERSCKEGEREQLLAHQLVGEDVGVPDLKRDHAAAALEAVRVEDDLLVEFGLARAVGARAVSRGAERRDDVRVKGAGGAARGAQVADALDLLRACRWGGGAGEGDGVGGAGPGRRESCEHAPRAAAHRQQQRSRKAAAPRGWARSSGCARRALRENCCFRVSGSRPSVPPPCQVIKHTNPSHLQPAHPAAELVSRHSFSFEAGDAVCWCKG